MSGTALQTIEDYLAASYEWEPEYVRGVIQERPMPTRFHGKLVYLLSRRLPAAVDASVECRLRLAPDVVRIADLAIFTEPDSGEVYPNKPPLVTLEVLSPDDRVSEAIEKCEEYRTWGVAHIWVIEPRLQKFYVYTAGLSERDRFELPEYGFCVTAESLFAAARQ